MHLSQSFGDIPLKCLTLKRRDLDYLYLHDRQLIGVVVFPLNSPPCRDLIIFDKNLIVNSFLINYLSFFRKVDYHDDFRPKNNGFKEL